MSDKAEAFEHWIRTAFVELNTELEQRYFAQDDRARVAGTSRRTESPPPARAPRSTPDLTPTDDFLETHTLRIGACGATH